MSKYRIIVKLKEGIDAVDTVEVKRAIELIKFVSSCEIQEEFPNECSYVPKGEYCPYCKE